MQFLIDFYKKLKLGFEIMIKDNITYLRFHTGHILEPIISNSNGFSDIYLNYVTLQFIMEVTNKINYTLDELKL